MTALSPVRRFIGGMLMAIGGLIAGLSGLCTSGFLVFFAYSLWTDRSSAGGSQREYFSLLLPIEVGAAPIILGLGLFFWGRLLFKRPLRIQRSDRTG